MQTELEAPETEPLDVREGVVLAGVRKVRKVRPPARTIRTTKDNVALLRNNSRTTRGG